MTLLKVCIRTMANICPGLKEARDKREDFEQILTPRPSSEEPTRQSRDMVPL